MSRPISPNWQFAAGDSSSADRPQPARPEGEAAAASDLDLLDAYSRAVIGVAEGLGQFATEGPLQFRGHLLLAGFTEVDAPFGVVGSGRGVVVPGVYVSDVFVSGCGGSGHGGQR